MGENNVTHAEVTLAAHDIGDIGNFAQIGRITVEQYHSAPEGPETVNADNSLMLDLMSDDDTILDDKYVSIETAAALLGWPVEGFLQRARQMLCQHVDELEAEMRRRRLARGGPS